MLPSARRMLVRPFGAVALLLVVATIVLTAAAGSHARPAEAELTCAAWGDKIICSEEVTVEADEPETETPKRLMPSAG